MRLHPPHHGGGVGDCNLIFCTPVNEAISKFILYGCGGKILGGPLAMSPLTLAYGNLMGGQPFAEPAARTRSPGSPHSAGGGQRIPGPFAGEAADGGAAGQRLVNCCAAPGCHTSVAGCCQQTFHSHVAPVLHGCVTLRHL